MQKQLGLSLVELMISITLGLILMAGVVQMFASSMVTFKSQQSISRIQETGRLAIEFMSKDIRAAGNYGCGKLDPANPVKALQNGSLDMGGLHRDFNVSIQGYNSVSDIPSPLTAATALGMASVAAGQNIIVVRSALDVGLPVTRLNEDDKVFAFTSQTDVVNNCVEGVCIGAAVVVGDCYGARAFKVSDLAVTTGEVTITPVASTPAWDSTNIPEQFKTGEVAPLKTVVYFIANGTSGSPSLFQRTNTDANAVELLEGVERMNISYARSVSRETYSTASIIGTNWADVVSVRIELVVRGSNSNAVDFPQPYTLSSGTVTPTDKYMRQVFSTTINLRNRNL
jgi:type IV pilus assembly protein PilW